MHMSRNFDHFFYCLKTKRVKNRDESFKPFVNMFSDRLKFRRSLKKWGKNNMENVQKS